ncbi:MULTISPECIES: hypothetical protein [Methanobrevibacter]|uniref:hypothetical protein n=1 Tax=Methanobrevibacter TaxID=2172 RepID=UPI0015C1120C|nr:MULTISPECIES: hypothetical protein [Methanobrevibacter]MCI7428453.1 hypothetical protein [Methanobrevibacter sp.]MDD6775681.1 hypothetical protein [Methanobacteriaceae archaeon]MDY3096790.1 hypothetical protein [Methanobrevibacter sp.]
MAVFGTTIFSHILPVICGVIGIVMIISGSLEDKNFKLGLGILLFVLACIGPYLVLSVLV